ncbi:MAG: AI-2E family transporter [Desulfobacteraceae bacterium]
MKTSSPSSTNRSYETKALSVTIHVGIVLLILFWCFKISQPFIEVIAWGIIIAVAIHPGYERLNRMMGGRRRLTAAVIIAVGLIVLLVPTIMLTGSLIDTAKSYSAHLDAGTLRIPPPPENVRSWPVVGKPSYAFWNLASVNLEAALSKVAPQLKKLGMPLFAAVAGLGAGILRFVVSIIIAGVLLANAAAGSRLALAFMTRLAGDEQGKKAVDLSEATVRSVALGILGVALIQTILAGMGFLVVDVPGAGFWALLVLILAIIQLPTILILGPIILYVFSTSSTGTAIVFAIWSLAVGMSDAFLKPLLMGRGVDVPMLVIFIGAIGGFVLSGIIGLFVGAIVFALGYKLFMDWLESSS